MLYLTTSHLENIGINWDQLTDQIKDTVKTMGDNDYSQPLKPYLRYGDAKNRIIAMPAYIGGENSLAGIKWIASFPDNIHKNIPRAHSVTILNKCSSGIPLCVINSTMISAIRTASVSGLLLKEFMKMRSAEEKLTVGIIGFGPIGKMHLRMIRSLLDGKIEKVFLFDIRGIDRNEIPEDIRDRSVIKHSWQKCYDSSDVLITCTVSDKSYIDRAPRKGSLQLNVSLRDYKTEMKSYMDLIVVDDWDEVCRQHTDIENMHLAAGLQKEDTLSILDVVCNQALMQRKTNDVVMFNPMGMAVFDIAVGGYYYRQALEKKMGIALED